MWKVLNKHREKGDLVHLAKIKGRKKCDLSMSCCSRVQRGFRSCPRSKVRPCLVVIRRSLQLPSGVFTVCRNSTPSLGDAEHKSRRLCINNFIQGFINTVSLQLMWNRIRQVLNSNSCAVPQVYSCVILHAQTKFMSDSSREYKKESHSGIFAYFPSCVKWVSQFCLKQNSVKTWEFLSKQNHLLSKQNTNAPEKFIRGHFV